ncbi:MAG: LL-diaminopimelate aminotransferase [Rikenellaceae bacterium]|jgi:LL-diaminopimelate aminotransferase|nr:LL-diaminopimelate aminotransferase [Rikenellaceae bacterium]
MALINSQFLKVSQDAVAREIEGRIKQFRFVNPGTEPIRLDSGDVALPLLPSVVNAMQASVSELGGKSPFLGRGPERGCSFLIEAIVKNDFKARGVRIAEEEIFINEGTKQDVASIGDILCRDNRIGVLDPIFQTYVESNVVGYRAGILEKGRHWSNIVYLTATSDNNFIPSLPEERPDVIFLSFPNDPTGIALTTGQLKKWVDYAIENKVLILFDATYEAFITSDDVPRSIYEIKGARKVAIEFHSFSKSAGFTGLHCGYTVIPREVEGYSIYSGKEIFFNDLWQRRQAIKSNAPSYIIQRAAEALYTEQGRREVRQNVDYYMSNASMLRAALDRTGLRYCGGVDAPFIWMESPWRSSWKLFEKLLGECEILSSPGERFGPSGEGYVRLSAFADQTQVMRASTRIGDWGK